ncbi:hypothetical protein EDD16DRAFT_1749099 [Pisolithus croceorrhizus]|nr:hypothetical protein EDD16DRAFT_1765604 [Pisolithus croceorrhizus]KAI6127665.1 hypothetical protein EDD16DRAFT_1749099 [Pisolithus croceorrhizus]
MASLCHHARGRFQENNPTGVFCHCHTQRYLQAAIKRGFCQLVQVQMKAIHSADCFVKVLLPFGDHQRLTWDTCWCERRGDVLGALRIVPDTPPYGPNVDEAKVKIIPASHCYAPRCRPPVHPPSLLVQECLPNKPLASTPPKEQTLALNVLKRLLRGPGYVHEVHIQGYGNWAEVDVERTNRGRSEAFNGSPLTYVKTYGNDVAGGMHKFIHGYQKCSDVGESKGNANTPTAMLLNVWKSALADDGVLGEVTSALARSPVSTVGDRNMTVGGIDRNSDRWGICTSVNAYTADM